MGKERLTAFTDGVVAIIITIMVLELKVPHGTSLSDLAPLLPVVLSYVLSFVYVAIYWNNHHHMLALCERVDGPILWANMHLLFWLSLVPFVTSWLSESHFNGVPVAAYGGVLIMAGLAYTILSRLLVHLHGPDSDIARAMGRDFKGYASLVAYALAIGLAFVRPQASLALYVAVAAMWFIPDRRVERTIQSV
ncbi:TMEM175 family protein [Phenylobacterium sp.]|jgi:uncharacterized membrane protein|uniref:TMEM175 family protein n=1 Tax=Phenylobacterium sp. TaxID=1871053 RepID=UPI002F41B27A